MSRVEAIVISSQEIQSTNPSWAEMLRSPILLLAFGFGSGKSPKAPGTVGTFAAVPLWLLIAQLPIVGQISTVLIAGILGIAICGRAAERLGVHDHGGIVWDEFVGFWLVMLFAPAGWLWLVLAFLLFRLFDIWKPQPIRLLDQRVAGGLGIMLDDVVAGIYAALALLLIGYVIG